MTVGLRSGAGACPLRFHHRVDGLQLDEQVLHVFQGEHIGPVGGGAVGIVVRLDEKARHPDRHGRARQGRDEAPVAPNRCALPARLLHRMGLNKELEIRYDSCWWISTTINQSLFNQSSTISCDVCYELVTREVTTLITPESHMLNWKSGM